jgi:hypothetical protein
MIQLFAPHPDYKILIHLPNAEWGDVQRLESTMQLRRSMNAEKTITHVRKMPASRVYEVNLNLTRLKSIEFMGFFELFGATLMKCVLDDEDKIGYVRINPLELEIIKRAIVGSSVEEVHTRFDFETVQ